MKRITFALFVVFTLVAVLSWAVLAVLPLTFAHAQSDWAAQVRATVRPAAAAQLRIEEITARAMRCAQVMDLGVCRKYGEARRTLPPLEAARLVAFTGGLGSITVGDEYRLSSNPAMCEQLRDDCAADWSGVGCRWARASFGKAKAK